MTLAADIRAALAPVVPQGDHPYLSTTDGMDAINAVAARHPGRTTPVHLRTGEYVVATFTDPDGRRVLARAGDVRVGRWHNEECVIAAAWADTGAPVAAPLEQFAHRSGVATVSLWDYLEHDTHTVVDPAAAGSALARMHAASSDTNLQEALAERPFRAPGKIARRILGLCGRAAYAGEGDTLLKAAASVADLSALIAGPHGAVHGDFQPGNWLTTAEGVIAIDLATACRGPLLWDLTLLEGRCGDARRYPRSYWENFCAGYQVSSTTLDGTAAQSLRTVATAVAALRRSTSPGSEGWARLRAACTG